jgi:DnaD/phage-associated family protein
LTGEAFKGFPDSALATTIPNLFFAQVMPLVERPEELAVSTYAFYAISNSDRSRRPRFVTRSELAADAALACSLAALAGDDGAGPLEAGLRLAVQRRTLVRAAIEANGRADEAFAVNTPANRRALEALAGAWLSLPEPLPPAASTAAPNVFALYEENIGTITPLMAEELQEAEQRYPLPWLQAAFREAVLANKRSWRYVERILRRWETEGPDYEESQRDTGVEWLERRYEKGKRRLTSRR